MLEQETAYYKANLCTLQEKYLGKYIVITGSQVIDSYDSDELTYAVSAPPPNKSIVINAIWDTGEPIRSLLMMSINN